MAVFIGRLGIIKQSAQGSQKGHAHYCCKESKAGRNSARQDKETKPCWQTVSREENMEGILGVLCCKPATGQLHGCSSNFLQEIQFFTLNYLFWIYFSNSVLSEAKFQVCNWVLKWPRNTLPKSKLYDNFVPSCFMT